MKDIKEITKNSSFRFLFPMIPLKDKDLVTEQFRTIHLGTGEYEDKLIITYLPAQDTEFNELDSKIGEIKTLIKDQDLNDGRIAYIFNIPDKYEKEIQLFKEGKYSEFSIDYKDQLLNFWGLNREDDPFYGILYKTKVGKQYYEDLSKKHRDNTAEEEYYPKPNMDNEIITI
jgi:hypothetical protein